MKLRVLALSALAALSFNANAALTSYAAWDNGPYPHLAGIQFNVVTAANGASVGMGAHPYTSGLTMPNNGIDTFYATPGLTNPLRANWSFDYAWDLTNCQGCTVALFVDTDPGAGETFVNLPGIIAPDSWNMEMNFMSAALGYDFNPFMPSSTAFSLRLMDAAGAELVRSNITVNVPEPGSMALLGLGLAGIGAMVRRRGKR